MGRKRQLRSKVLTIVTLCCLFCSCIDSIHNEQNGNPQDVTVIFGGNHFLSKSADPDENKISDISLMIFDEYGTIEEFRWIPAQDIEQVIANGLKIKLATNKRYNFFGCVNFGYKVYIDSAEKLDDIIYHLVYPDDFRNGMPMFISQENIMIDSGLKTVVVPIKRMMSKISVQVDRSALDKDVHLNVLSARIGNCPRSMQVFGKSKVTDESGCFTAGYSKNEFEADKMNIYGADGLSEEVSLYMLENMQGQFDGPEEAGKVFPEGDIRRKICSYIEIGIEYTSPDKASWDSPLKYRLYLGENDKDLNVERNCHYHITIKPENDGLSKDGWNIDKSGICTFIKEIRLSSENINLEYEGESILLESYISPKDATFQNLIWSSSNQNVATVSESGIVTATGEGSCKIMCTSPDGAGANASCTVICKFKECYMHIHPQEYITGNPGDKVHIWCEFFPPSAHFDIGTEELEHDKERGIYDYTIDENGYGVTLTLKKPGRGILYMSAGYPINDSRMVIIEVNTPANYAIEQACKLSAQPT